MKVCKRIVVGLVLLVITAGVAQGNFCAFDNSPAASLLFPFVILDFDDPSTTSVLSITNLSSEAQVVHVTIWSDLGEAIFDFNVLLTGYDVERFDIAEIFVEGQVPITVSGDHQEDEGVIDAGPVSGLNDVLPYNWTVNVLADPQPTIAVGERCSPEMDGYPGRYVSPIPPALLDLLERFLRVSQQTDFYFSDDCDDPFSGDNLYDYRPEPWMNSRDEDSPVWMYVTVDVVETCNRYFPSDYGYWLPGDEGGEARYDNVLTGNMVWRSPDGAVGAQVVHLEADKDMASVVARAQDSQPVSFYHRHSSLEGSVSDAREPLPTAWALHFEGGFTEQVTRLRVWKGSTDYRYPLDSQLPDFGSFIEDSIIANCLPYTFYAWDLDENIVRLGWGLPGSESVEPNLLPLAVQEIPVDQLLIPDDEGWLLFVWPPANYGQPYAPDPPDSYQVWMGAMNDPEGIFAHFLPGIPVGNTNCFTEQILPQLGINYDYVDSKGYRGRNRAASGPPLIN